MTVLMLFLRKNYAKKLVKTYYNHYKQNHNQ